MANGEAACCGNGLLRFDKPGPLSSDFLFEDAGEATSWLLTRPVQMGSQMIYRTSALRAIGGFDEHLTALCDLDAVLRLSEVGGVVMLPEPMFTARADGDAAACRLEYADGRRLLRKYEDALLLDRKLARGCSALLAKQAAHLYLWLDAVSYFFSCPFCARRSFPRSVEGRH